MTTRFLLFANQLYSYSILRPVQAAIRRRGGEAVWFVHGVDPGYLVDDERRLNSVAEVRGYAPEAVVTAANWVPHLFPGLKVQVFHGFNALKRDPGVGHFRIRGQFDLYCTQGPSTTGPFQALAHEHRHFRVIETGWPKVDPLFDPTAPAWPGVAGETRPIVLFASTFSRRLTAAPLLLEAITRLAASGRWRWLVNLHPKMPAEIVAAYRALSGPNIELVETDDVLPLLRAADAMLCDTSSILFEFMLLDKPVVTFRHRQPGPAMHDIDRVEQLEPALELALQRPPEQLAAAREFVARMHPYTDGGSSQRVLAAIDTVRAGGPRRRKPLNLWRRLQTRRRLGYWRPW